MPKPPQWTPDEGGAALLQATPGASHPIFAGCSPDLVIFGYKPNHHDTTIL